MATRQGEAAAFVARVSEVAKWVPGWKVQWVTSQGIWKITTPEGPVIQVHQTPSDSNFLKSMSDDLNKYGFALAERQAEQAKSEDRRARLAADRSAADAKAKRQAAQRALVAKAAGPYAPHDATADEILAKHTEPRTFHHVEVTPEMAKAFLERNEPMDPPADWPNRPLYQADVDIWVTTLRSGRWKYTHQGVAFDWDGRLQDGQNRLTAIMQSGITAPMMVSVGMDPENFKVVDSGRKRTAAQVLRMKNVMNSNVLAAGIRQIHLYQKWGSAMLDHGRERITSDVLAEAYDSLNRDQLAAAVDWAHALRREIGAPLTGSMALAYLLRQEMPADEPLLVQFEKEMIDGIVGEDRDKSPVWQLRRQLTRSAVKARGLLPPEQLALMIRGWNAHVSPNYSGKMIVSRSGSSMPLIKVPEPTFA